MAQAPAQNGQPRMEELVPNLNNYIRGRLAKSEVRISAQPTSSWLGPRSYLLIVASSRRHLPSQTVQELSVSMQEDSVFGAALRRGVLALVWCTSICLFHYLLSS